MTTVKTNSGDTWDSVAWRLWGKGADQTHMADLIEANEKYVDTAIFAANVELTVPDVEDDSTSAVPPWRR